MEENKCVDCQGCGDAHQPVMPPASTAAPCVGAEPCSKIYSAGCVHVNQDFTCGNDMITGTDTRLPETLQNIVTYFCTRFSNLPNQDVLINSVTYAQAEALITDEEVVPGAVYFISDRGIALMGNSTGSFSISGVRTMRVLQSSVYAVAGVNKGIWRSSLPVVANDVVIWGGRAWQNATGASGTATSLIALDNTNWTLIPTSDIAHYQDKVFEVIYDFQNDWVSEQKDDRGNRFGISFDLESTLTFGFNFCDHSDWSKPFIIDNNCYGVMNNLQIVIGNSNRGFIYNNDEDVLNNTNAGDISENTVGSVSNNTNGGYITNNQGQVSTNNNTSYISANIADVISNGNTGRISGNSCTEIRSNTNRGFITNNSVGNNISYNSNSGSINNNANTGSIHYNLNNGNINGLLNTVTDVEYNINNGNIVTTVVGAISDPIVNK